MVAILMRGRFWALLGAIAITGCPGVAIRPDGSPAEEKCPAGAREAMEAFSLAPGDLVAVSIDATHPKEEPLIVYDGPIESSTWDPMGESPGGMAVLPGNVLLSGRVWTGGPRVMIRYYKARLPDGKVIPFCAEVSWQSPGLPKSSSRLGVAVVPLSFGMAAIREQFK